MNLTLIAIGSRGDVQPCVALGRGLLEVGYAVRFVTFETFRPMVTAQGLAFWPVAGDAQALTQQVVGANGLNLWQSYRAIMRSFGSLTEAYEQALAAPELRHSQPTAGRVLWLRPCRAFGCALYRAVGHPTRGYGGVAAVAAADAVFAVAHL